MKTSGPELRRLSPPDANEQHLYFTSPSLTPDDGTLVFLSDRLRPVDPALDLTINESAPQDLFARNLRTGETWPLVEPGGDFTLHPCLHAGSGDVFFGRGRELLVTNIHRPAARVLVGVPEGQRLKACHVSSDRSRLAIAFTPDAAFGTRRPIDVTPALERLGLRSTIRIYDLEDLRLLHEIDVGAAYVTHLQFRPGRREELLFNHEHPPDWGIRRMWLWAGQRAIRLREEGANANGTRRSRHDWVCHEIWSEDGEWIIYHGSHGPEAEGRFFVGRMAADGSSQVEINFPASFRGYGHFMVGRSPDLLVTDGYAHYPDDTNVPQLGATESRCGDWLSLLRVDWAASTIAGTPLCRHATSWLTQDTHPHPLFTHAGDRVIFTSDASGRRAIYTVSLA